MNVTIPKLSRFVLSLVAGGGATLFIVGGASAAVDSPDLTQVSSNIAAKVVSVLPQDGPSTPSVVNLTPALVQDEVTTSSNATIQTSDETSEVQNVPNTFSKTQAIETPVIDTTPSIDQGPAEAMSKPATITADVTSPVVEQPVFLATATVTATPQMTYPESIFTPAAQAQNVAASLYVPTTNAPLKLPEPPRSEGLFTMFASELAGTIVPQSFRPLVTGVEFPVSILGLALTFFVAIFLTLLVETYGRSLRQAGYVTAARSGLLFPPFATPFLMDYGRTDVPIVFFHGVRDQKNTYITSANAY